MINQISDFEEASIFDLGPVGVMAPPSKLSIATSSVQRLLQEESSYHKELEQQEGRVSKLQKDNSGENAEYLLRQEVLLHVPSWSCS